jgi:hypothetical protein
VKAIFVAKESVKENVLGAKLMGNVFLLDTEQKKIIVLLKESSKLKKLQMNKEIGQSVKSIMNVKVIFVVKENALDLLGFKV